MASSNVSGMAASIRAATESETFDLAGCTKSTVTTTIESAFSSPFPLTEMIRITFIVGAGKLGRSRYDENTHKTVTSVLRDQGYEEDRAASCVNECAGTFKSQHDTGKNLKTIVVFPKLAALADQLNDMALEHSNDADQPLLDPSTPQSMIALSSLPVFSRMLTGKCHSWSQKKSCIASLQEVKTVLEKLDAKLLGGTPLTNSEQDFYDQVTLDSLTQKETLAKTEMQKHVEEGRITRSEKNKLQTQVQEKISNLDKSIQEANDENKPKKAEKLTAQKQKLLEREKVVGNITPVPPHPLKHEMEIRKLRKEMQPLLKLEKETKGRLLSLKETTVLSRKDEILEEIEILEYQSAGWFEDPEEFQIRVEASRAVSQQRQAKKTTTVKKTTSGSGTSFKKPTNATSWVTPAARRRTVPKPKGKGGGSGGNMFSAMMADSDSD